MRPVPVVGFVVTHCGLSVVDELLVGSGCNGLGHGHEEGLGMPVGALVVLHVVLAGSAVHLDNDQAAVGHRGVGTGKVSRELTVRLLLVHGLVVPVDVRVSGHDRLVRRRRGGRRQRLCRIHLQSNSQFKITNVTNRNPLFTIQISKIAGQMETGKKIMNWKWKRQNPREGERHLYLVTLTSLPLAREARQKK